VNLIPIFITLPAESANLFADELYTEGCVVFLEERVKNSQDTVSEMKGEWLVYHHYKITAFCFNP
jgi:hypothetical protein